MWFFILLFLFFSGALGLLLYRTENARFLEKVEKDSDVQKMKRLKEAKELIRLNKELTVCYTILVETYSEERHFKKSKLTKTVINILDETQDAQLTTAICALAKMESKRRMNKDVSKSEN